MFLCTYKPEEKTNPGGRETQILRLTQKEGMEQQGQVYAPVFFHTVIHHQLRHKDHGYVTPEEPTQKQALKPSWQLRVMQIGVEIVSVYKKQQRSDHADVNVHFFLFLKS